MLNSKSLTATALVAGIAATSPSAALVNGDFSEIDGRSSGSVSYATTGSIGFLPGWVILSAGGASIDTGTPVAAQGTSSVRFNALTTGFGANKLDQCVQIDAAEVITLGYSVRTDAGSITNDYRVRLNPNFYVDMETCERDVQSNVTTNRLLGDAPLLPNADWDIQFSTAEIGANTWYQITSAGSGPMIYNVDNIPSAATVMRLSVRVRAPVADANIWIDDVRVMQEGINLVRNGSFEHRDVADTQFLSGSAGWRVSRDGDTALRAAAGAESRIAVEGDNVFYFGSLSGNFSGSSLDQCVPVTATEDLQPRLFVMSYLPDVDLNVRINVDFFTDADCAVAADSALRLREDFAIDGASGAWQTLTTAEIRLGSALAGIQSALFSIRARDRSNETNDGPDGVARGLYIDDVSLVAAVPAPTFVPGSQTFSSASLDVVLNGPVGSTIFYTLDGTTPDLTSLSIASGGAVVVTETTTIRAVAFIDPDFSSVRSATYTRVAPPFIPPTGPLNRSTGGLGVGALLIGLLLLRRRFG